MRPRCDVCARKHKSCNWSEALAPGGYRYVLFGESTSGESPASTPTPTTQPREALYDANNANNAFDLLQLPLRHRLVHTFAQTHHVLELCGCIQLDVFNDQAITIENSFLLESILALSALYLPDASAKADSRFTGSKSIVRHYRSKAQASSRQSSDQPTSKPLCSSPRLDGSLTLPVSACRVVGRGWCHTTASVNICLRDGRPEQECLDKV